MQEKLVLTGLIAVRAKCDSYCVVMVQAVRIMMQFAKETGLDLKQ